MNHLGPRLFRFLLPMFRHAASPLCTTPFFGRLTFRKALRRDWNLSYCCLCFALTSSIASLPLMCSIATSTIHT